MFPIKGLMPAVNRPPDRIGLRFLAGHIFIQQTYEDYHSESSQYSGWVSGDELEQALSSFLAGSSLTVKIEVAWSDALEYRPGQEMKYPSVRSLTISRQEAELIAHAIHEYEEGWRFVSLRDQLRYNLISARTAVTHARNTFARGGNRALNECLQEHPATKQRIVHISDLRKRGKITANTAEDMMDEAVRSLALEPEYSSQAERVLSACVIPSIGCVTVRYSDRCFEQNGTPIAIYTDTFELPLRFIERIAAGIEQNAFMLLPRNDAEAIMQVLLPEIVNNPWVPVADSLRLMDTPDGRIVIRASNKTRTVSVEQLLAALHTHKADAKKSDCSIGSLVLTDDEARNLYHQLTS